MGAARVIRFISLVALLVPTIALGQRIQVPDGTRHFIILVDSSFSMVADSPAPNRRDAKRRALAEAEEELTSVLFDRGKVVNASWFRRGRDLITIVDYGFDSNGAANSAYKRLRWASLGSDYVRATTKASSELDRDQFGKRLRPRRRTHLNVLAWALPMGIDAASVGRFRPVQDTYVILLNDAQMNDGSMVLEKYTMGQHLNAKARARLQEKEKLFADSILLTDKDGSPGAMKQAAFGPSTDKVVLTVFRAMSTVSQRATEAYKELEPLENVDLGWSGNALDVKVHAPKQLNGMNGSLRIDGKVGHSSTPVKVEGDVNSTISNLTREGAGKPAKLSLAITQQSTNALLGKQVFNIAFDREVLVPASSNSGKYTLWALGLLALAATGWAYHQRMVARHFRVWLPDYTLPTSLPPLANDVTTHFSSRVPKYDGEEAAWMELPHAFVRKIFYRDSTLRWDERLSVPGHGEATEAKLTSLPRFVTFVWSGRPASGGEYDLVVERPKSGGRNHRLKATVRFLSLPQSSDQ
jgi:hypothetical protein